LGGSIVSDIVTWDGHRWFRKFCAAWPELLGYRLARDWANVATVIDPGEVVGATFLNGKALEPAVRGASVLVRLADSYSPPDLVVASLDEAMARELAFSLWIRRRDAHPWNRGYVDGVPIFFDHHIAFGVEAENTTVEGFFRRGGDGGYAGRWRVMQLPQDVVPTTRTERDYSGLQWAVHRVQSVEAFEHYLDIAVEEIMAIRRPQLDTEAQLAAADRPEAVVDFLESSRVEVPAAIARLRQTVYEPLS
jgi:hypothetical protein